MNVLVNFLIHLQMVTRGRLAWIRFLRQTRNPDAVQRQVLRSILQRNRNTQFGRGHGFREITSPEQYAARVPLQSYEDLRPYIERQEHGEPLQLTADAPILFAQTSGTTGHPKYVPILARTVAQARANQRLYSYCHHSAIPGLFQGQTLAFVSPAIEGVRPSGVPFGSMSGLIYQSMPWLLRRKYVVPAAVFAALDHELKYRLIAAFAVRERNVTYLAAANPSTLLKLADVIRSHAEWLIRAVRTGSLPELERLDAQAQREIRRSFAPDSGRARELTQVLDSRPADLFARLWPDLKAVSCWREGSCRVLLPALRGLLPPALPILELGYLASEGRCTLPVDSVNHREVPSLHEHYFEFIERSDWEAGQRQVKTLSELEVGRAYYVILTTAAGLYRYVMNDVVTVDGRWERTPTIKFLEKGAGATNITGEKLYESQVTEAVEALLADAADETRFFLLVADDEALRYDLYLENPGITPAGLVEKLDTELAIRNIEYRAKRASGRLRAPQVILLAPGTGERYKAHLIAQGQREAQFKFVRLVARARLSFDLVAHSLGAPA